MAALNISGKIEDGHCDCPAGKVACNHLTGVLRTLALVQSKGFSQAQQQLSCTDLPQQRRVPRGDHIRGTSIQSVDWRSVRQGGLDTPTTSRLYDSRLCQSPAEARTLERDTRQQAKSPRWHKERGLRLTASNFGTAATRESWSEKGLHNLTSKRDLSRVPAIRRRGALLPQLGGWGLEGCLQNLRTPVYGKRGPKWCIASPGGPRRVQTYPGLSSTTRMPFSPDTGKPRTARRGRANPHGSGSVETPLSKHLFSQVPPAGGQFEVAPKIS
ncbi:hypothetical protein ISCGN_029984 [Ixodes scapularis]